MAGINVKQYKEGRLKSNEKKKDKDFSIESILNKEINFGGNSFSDSKKEKFYSELNILLSSGLDLRSSLDLIENEQEKQKEKDFFNAIKENIIKGKSLFEATQLTNKFTPYEVYSLKIGEESGRLKDVLNELNKYFLGKIKQRRQLISALSYPVIVLLTAFGAIYFMMGFIVPMFSDVFLRFGGELPTVTRVVLSISEFVSNYALYTVLFLLILLVFLYSQRKKDTHRKFFSVIVLRLPFFGKLIQDIYIARFCHIMGLLSSAKVPMLQSVSMVAKMISFYPMEITMKKIEEDILTGSPLYKSLEKYPIYSKRIVSLIKVGEEVNQLDNIFEKLAEQLSNEIEYKTGLLSSLLEPLLIIFLALVVGTILISMYLPMFQLSSGLM